MSGVTLEPVDEMVAVRDDLRLHVRRWEPDADRGLAPFVLAHGLASNARMWDGVAARLADHGHRVVAVDQRGHGPSDKPDVGYDLPTVADDLARLVEATGLERPVVAGQSWGGNVVIELGARHGHAVRGIACVDGGMIDLRSRFPDWEQAKEVLAPPRTAGMRAEDLEAMVRSSHPAWPESGIQGVLACFERRDDGTVAPWLTFDRHLTVLRGLWEHDPLARLDEVTVPVLLIPADSGAESSWAHDKSEVVSAAEERLGGRVRTRWLAGHHDLHAEQPDAVASLLLEALEDLWT